LSVQNITKVAATEIFSVSEATARYSPTFARQPKRLIPFIKTKNHTSMANKVNVTPLHDRVIVKPAAAEEKTAGGIIIPDTAKEKPQRGTVIAAGPGKKDEPVTVKEGDTVLYGKYAGTEISIEGDDFLIMRESDILAIV
jgi:chaperonin GroES